jgi:hypothetical protein
MRRICSIASNIAGYRIDTLLFLQPLAVSKPPQRSSVPFQYFPFPVPNPSLSRAKTNPAALLQAQQLWLAAHKKIALRDGRRAIVDSFIAVRF